MEKKAIMDKVAKCSDQLDKNSGFGSWMTRLNDVYMVNLNEQTLTIKDQADKYYISAVFADSLEDNAQIVGEMALGSFMGEVFVGTIAKAELAAKVIGGENPLYNEGFALKTNTTLIKKVGVLKAQLERMLGEKYTFEVVNGFTAPFNKTKLEVIAGLKAKKFWKAM